MGLQAGTEPYIFGEENLAMNDRTPAPGSSGEQRSGRPGEPDEAREVAMMRAVIREQERHREGGVEPELDDVNEDPDSDA